MFGAAFRHPVGALISADMDNLLLARKVYQRDFFAHASYRVGGTPCDGGGRRFRRGRALERGIELFELPSSDLTFFNTKKGVTDEKTFYLD